MASVAIIGGGIGGLAAALAFSRAGAQVSVYEQASEIAEVGAGIQITPNGARVLDALGLGEEAARRGLRAEAVEPMDALTGVRVTRFDLTKLDGPPYRFFHRADLIDLLLTGCRAAGVTIHLDARIESVGDDGTFTSESGPQRADLVVGADGIRSVCRPVLNGTDDPFFTGQVAWRAVIDDPGHPSAARIWMAPGRHVVTYPLHGGRLNIVAVQERREWAAEGWSHAAEPITLRSAFNGLSGRVSGLLDRVEEVGEWGLFRHPVALTWHRDRLALLGDAAHPTLPFLAQGANLALEDAWTLVACWTADRLETYAAERRDRVNRAIGVANRNAVNYHLSGPRRAASHLVLKGIGKVAPTAFLKRLDWLYAHDVTQASSSTTTGT
ncbi:FAD-dependent monooxygenase [Pelagovum pacificum]|uniref:Monooxygenase n=1 Tax=Pelagovum pacificum TaxID=2588711 RepID=A0A5C5GEG0_9RHOB|nr:FAD-dependent monooxygenase [Pelagovum pacificum]QQA44556.1 FAD-dependent monooxygenase [Pelagovum pacificum]TNY32331.1 monooxygenase [Pelagovum pacificum]